MRTVAVFVTLSTIFMSACGAIQSDQLNKLSGSLSASDAYLLDSVESTASADATSSTTATSSVASDLTDAQLEEMATRLLSVADSDASGSLSLEEFLAGPELMRKTFEGEENEAPGADEIAQMKVKLTEDFTKYAGDDQLMTSDEIVTFLAASAPRVSHHRDHGNGGCKKRGQDHGRGPGKARGERPAESWDSIEAKFDLNGDGSLNKDEFDAYMKARHAQHHNQTTDQPQG